MATIVIRDFIYDDLGLPVGGIRARAYPKTEVDERELGWVGVEDFSRSASGMWQLTLDSNLSPTGIFTIELYNPSTGQIRWRDGHIRLQVEALFGAHGAAPIPDQSITAGKIQDGAVINAKMNDNSISSMKLLASDRTVDQNIASAVNTGSLGQIISSFGRMIRLITGNADWKTAPPTNLSTVFTHMADSTIHQRGVTVGLAAPLTSGYNAAVHTAKFAAGTVLVSMSSNVGQFYLNVSPAMNGIITIQLTEASTPGNVALPIAVESWETSFPDTTVLITFRTGTVANNTQVRVNFLVLYW